MNKNHITFAEALRDTLREELVRDPNIIIIGEDILNLDRERQAVAGDIGDTFPHRVLNHLPLVEEMLGGIGLGLSFKGLKPIIQLDYSTFLTLMFGDIHRIGTWRYRMFEKSGPGIVFRVGHEGYTGKGAELTTSFLGAIFHFPNIRIVIPSQPYYAKGLLRTALRSGEPVIFFEHKQLYEMTDGPELPEEDYMLPFGLSPIFRHGNDITLIAWGYTSCLALQAAEALAKKGIQTEVIVPQTLHPLNMEPIFASAEKTRAIVVIEEDMLRGGIGAEICARIAEKSSGYQIQRIAAKNTSFPTGKKLEEPFLPTTPEIIRVCEEIVKRKPWRLW